MNKVAFFVVFLSLSFVLPLKLFGASVFKGYSHIPKVRILILEDSIQQVIEDRHVFWIGLQRNQKLYSFPKSKDYKSITAFLRAREQSQRILRFAVDPYVRKIAAIRDVDKSSR